MFSKVSVYQKPVYTEVFMYYQFCSQPYLAVIFSFSACVMYDYENMSSIFFLSLILPSDITRSCDHMVLTCTFLFGWKHNKQRNFSLSRYVMVAATPFFSQASLRPFPPPGKIEWAKFAYILPPSLSLPPQCTEPHGASTHDR